MKKLPSVVFAVSTLLAGPIFAAHGTWSGGGTDGNWSNSDNWSLASIPGSSISGVINNADTATFNSTVVGNSSVLIDTYRNLKSIAFDTGAGSYTFGSMGGTNPLYLTSGGAIAQGVGVTGTGLTQTFNAPIVLEPTTSTTTGAYSFNNANASVTNILKFAGGISGGITSAASAGASAIVLTINGNNAGNNEISGAISNGGATNGVAVNKSNSGKWILSGNNTYTGLTTIGNGGGTLWLTGDNIGTTGGVTMAGGGTLGIGSPTALGTGILSMTNASMWDNVSGSALTLTTNNAINIFGSSGSITFVGSNDLNMGTGAFTNNTNAGNFTVNDHTLTFGGNFTIVNPNLALTKQGAGALSLTGVFSSGKNIIMNAGTLNLSGDNSGFGAGVVVSAANLGIGSVTALGTGTLTLNNASATIDNTSGSSETITTNNNVNVANSFTFKGSNDLNLGTGTVNLSVSATATVLANKLTVGTLTGTGNLTKAGSGVLIVTGDSTNSGTTTVTAGTLLVSGVTSGQGGYTISNGAALGGAGGTIGTAAKNVTLASGAKLDISNDGTLNAGTMTLALGAGLFDVSNAVGGANTGELLFRLDTVNLSDRIQLGLGTSMNVGGVGTTNLDLSDFSFTLMSNFGAGTYILVEGADASTLFTASNALGAATTTSWGGFDATLSIGFDGSTGNKALLLTVAAVPEPSTCALIIGGLVVMAGVAWKRQGQNGTPRELLS